MGLKGVKHMTGHRGAPRGAGNRGRGSVSVEMAIIAPILITLLFGTVEMGMIMKDVLSLNSAAREGARSASIGDTNTDIDNRIDAAAPGINTTNLTITLQYRTYSSGTWSSWATLTTTSGATSNSAPSGSQIQVQLSYPHPLIMGKLFTSLLATNQTNNTMTLNATMIMMRE